MAERTVPDPTAARVALWRAQHVELDPAPHVLDDVLGLELLAPPPGWRERPDMHPERTARNRASIVARGRFVEDELAASIDDGIAQYVILGAGLDTFAQRRPDLAARGTVFEVDQPDTQAWKQRRLAELDHPPAPWLRFVPADFEAGASWPAALVAAGFVADRPTLVSSLGVCVYLSDGAVDTMLHDAATLAPGSLLVVSFMIPLDEVAADEQPALRGAAAGAQAGGTPWISYFRPVELVARAHAAGFAEVRHVSPDDLVRRYFTGRAGPWPSSAEHLLVARV